MTDVQTKPEAAEITATYDAVIVGAGFAGMYMLHKLRGLGFTARVYDAAGGVGGTWYWNRYPGARCDVKSVDYSFSFDPELEQEWEWSEKYATQPEILRYANHVADRYELWPDMQFDTRIESSRWDGSRWIVTTDQGDVVSAQHVIMAVGTLSTPKLPEVPGIDTFTGAKYQTSKWPHEGVDFTGKRVAVIGTGSSAIQSIPIIAAQAVHTTVFQRTPNFSMPAGNRPLDGKERQIKRELPRAPPGGEGVVLRRPDRRRGGLGVRRRRRRSATATFQAGWDDGNLVGLIGAYNDILFDKAANDFAAEFIRNKIRETVKDPDVAETLCPFNHPVGTKRPCLDTNYYATFNQPNVDLVDLRKTPITEITPTGIRTTAGDIECDAIVFATGFDAMTGSLVAVDVEGVGGATLRDGWTDGPTTYLGVAIAGFPNFYTVTGPQSPSVLSNMMVSIEQHVDWIAEAITYLRDHGLTTIEATPEAQEAWVAHSNELAEETLYPLANSWYMGANVPGKPQVFLPYIGGCGLYRERCDEVAANDYEGFKLA